MRKLFLFFVVRIPCNFFVVSSAELVVFKLGTHVFMSKKTHCERRREGQPRPVTGKRSKGKGCRIHVKLLAFQSSSNLVMSSSFSSASVACSKT